MDHIRQFDWCYYERDSEHFVSEHDLDNSVTERLLRDKFKDPLFSSSESEDENPTTKFNWDEIIKSSKNNKKVSHYFTPGLKPLPGYPKLSVLTVTQHFQCLKVLAAENPLVNENHVLPRPTRIDHKIFAEVKLKYEKEQKEYIQWAKKLWATGQNIRILRPKPSVESVYGAEFNFHTSILKSLPKYYELAAQIPLEVNNKQFSLLHRKDLIMVNPSLLPNIKSLAFKHNYTIIRNQPHCQEICEKHLCQFVLPNEKYLSTLPLVEIHEELAQYASINSAQFIISEDALNCLIEHKKSWLLPVTVHEVIGLDGETQSVFVIGDAFSLRKEPAAIRTYTAFKHMLHRALILSHERMKMKNILNESNTDTKNDSSLSDVSLNKNTQLMDTCSDDDEDNLIIDFAEDQNDEPNDRQKLENKTDSSPMKNKTDAEATQCTCKEDPPLRSYRKWEVKNKTTNENINIIIHCAHQAKNQDSEIILEPVPEYQLDLGGTELPPEKIRSLALSLFLRQNAILMNVRVDGQSGDIVTYEYTDLPELEAKHGNTLVLEAANIIFTTLNQLQGLLPGCYVLQHESDHGPNALLYAARTLHTGAQSLSLDTANTQLPDEDEARYLKIPPTLCPVLLPYHKTRKILPLAFSPFPNQVLKDFKKPPAKVNVPPPAFQWPKKKKKKNRKKNNAS